MHPDPSAHVAAVPVRDRWFLRGDVRLFAADSGDGPPLVLLHGGLASHVAVRHWAAPLAARWRVITPDLRASGRSRHAGALSWDDLADDVAALLDHLAIARAVVGGTSFGAGVAVRAALRHPTRVAGLAVLDPAYGGAALGLDAAQRAAMDAMAAAGARALVDGARALHPLLAALPAALRDRARDMVDGFDPASVAALTRFMASGAQPFDRGDALEALAMPALLVPGADPTHPPEVADVYRRHLRRLTVVEVGAGIDRPGLAAAVDAFAGAVWAQQSSPA